MYKLGRNVLFSGNPQSLNMPVLVEITKSSAFVNTIEGACRRNLGELTAFADTIERCRRRNSGKIKKETTCLAHLC